MRRHRAKPDRSQFIGPDGTLWVHTGLTCAFCGRPIQRRWWAPWMREHVS